MHPQLELLLEIQDLKAQKREMESPEESREIEEEVFQVELDNAVEQLDAKIREMEEALEPEIASRYELVAARRGRAVVPVINGVCYGCFMSMPTAISSEHNTLRWCENCGSFVYFVD